MTEKHLDSCQCDRCREIKEQQAAEQQKKQQLYDPGTCAEQGEPGCTYPDCDNCEVDYSEEGEDW